MTPKRPDDHFAFMPSSNDSLSPNGRPNGSFPDGNISPRSLLNHPGNEAAIHSPPNMSSYMPSLSSVPSREQIPSASTLPPSATTGALEREVFFEDLYHRAIDNHDRDKEVWRTERSFLHQERQQLRDEIARLRAVFGRTGSTGQDAHDKVFYDPSTVKNANEKLRQLSVVSGSGSNTARVSREGSMSGDQPVQVKEHGSTSEMDRLPSIKEDMPDIDGVNLKLPPVVVKPIEEDPPSPPSTARAAISSPLPSNYTMHAGHTPMGSLSRIPPEENPVGQGYWEDQAQAKAPHVPKDVFTPESRGDPQEQVLKGPYILPSRPDDQGNSMLDELTGKLQDVAEFPKANRPDVLRDDVTESDVQTEDQDDRLSQSAENRKSGESEDETAARQSTEDPIRGAVKGTDENVGGIRLKMKSSMNFGAPFGRSS